MNKEVISVLTIKAYAKINLFLNVVGVKENGYHDLEMVNAKIDMADILRFEETFNQPVVVIKSNDLFLEKEGNLLYKVAHFMMNYYVLGKSIQITVEKNIPPGAGLAGNSTDAAAIIKGLNELFDLDLSNSQMEQIGSKFGADIPYCLYDQPAIVKGIGDIIEFVKLPLDNCKVLVVKPQVFLKTEDVFHLGDQIGFDQSDLMPMIDAINTQDQKAFIASMKNSLEKPSFEISPETKATKTLVCEELGCDGVIMSGSGSTILKVSQAKMNDFSAFFEKYVNKYMIFQANIVNKE
ncbi:MAG: 4-(cytidine 5'-diphospho)-2-C-methyl-D-erythritol kinase [Tenericutes bacterium HGW-Tenericutes-1]|nr:MAG: 4-(cytidine 5'-diphospho)-2-C-methyl-D-erythritol kinase [Tenericutes bacterium HGW-Tenericutes-1]